MNDRESDKEIGITHESAIHWWKLIGPSVVCASKLGAMLPRRRAGIVNC